MSMMRRRRWWWWWRQRWWQCSLIWCPASSICQLTEPGSCSHVYSPLLAKNIFLNFLNDKCLFTTSCQQLLGKNIFLDHFHHPVHVNNSSCYLCQHIWGNFRRLRQGLIIHHKFKSRLQTYWLEIWVISWPVFCNENRCVESVTDIMLLKRKL